MCVCVRGVRMVWVWGCVCVHDECVGVCARMVCACMHAYVRSKLGMEQAVCQQNSVV